MSAVLTQRGCHSHRMVRMNRHRRRTNADAGSKPLTGARTARRTGSAHRSPAREPIFGSIGLVRPMPRPEDPLLHPLLQLQDATSACSAVLEMRLKYRVCETTGADNGSRARFATPAARYGYRGGEPARFQACKTIFGQGIFFRECHVPSAPIASRQPVYRRLAFIAAASAAGTSRRRSISSRGVSASSGFSDSEGQT